MESYLGRKNKYVLKACGGKQRGRPAIRCICANKKQVRRNVRCSVICTVRNNVKYIIHTVTNKRVNEEYK